MSQTPTGRPDRARRGIDRVGDADHEIGDADAGRQDPAERTPQQEQDGRGEGHRTPQDRPDRRAVGMGDAAELEEADAARGDGDRVREAEHGTAEERAGRAAAAGRRASARVPRRHPASRRRPSALVAGWSMLGHRGTVAPSVNDVAPSSRRSSPVRRPSRHAPPAAGGRSRGSAPGPWATETLARLMPEELGRVCLAEAVDQEVAGEAPLARRHVVEQAAEHRAEVGQKRVGISGSPVRTTSSSRAVAASSSAGLGIGLATDDHRPARGQSGGLEPGGHEGAERVVGIDERRRPATRLASPRGARERPRTMTLRSIRRG